MTGIFPVTAATYRTLLGRVAEHIPPVYPVVHAPKVERWLKVQRWLLARKAKAAGAGPVDRKRNVTDRIRPFAQTPYYAGQPVCHGPTREYGCVVGEDAPAGWVAVRVDAHVGGRVEYWRDSETRTSLKRVAKARGARRLATV